MDFTDGSALGVFTCELCELSSPYSFYGQKPPNTRAIVSACVAVLCLDDVVQLAGFHHLNCKMLLEECYGMKDPFSPEREKFLVLGSKCCLCSKMVCVGTDCSLFYTKRFCLPCVRDHLRQFPEQVQNEVLRKKTVQKTSSS